MDVHPGTRDPGYGLGHKSGIQATFLGNRLEHIPKGKGCVGCRQSIVIPKVNLVLAWGPFVMPGLHLNPKGLEGRRHFLPDDHPAVRRGIKVPRLIVCRPWDGSATGVRLKQEELQFWAHVKPIAHGLDLGEGRLEHCARRPLKVQAIRREHVADEPCRLVHAVLPGDHGKRIQIWNEEHVALADAGKAVD